MNTYVILSCLLAFVGYSHADGIGLGGLGYASSYISRPIISAPVLAPAAISTANVYKAAPIPIIRTAAVAPVFSAPIVKSISPIASIAPIGLGLGGLDLGGHSLAGVGLSGLGLSGLGLKGLGLASPITWGGLDAAKIIG